MKYEVVVVGYRLCAGLPLDDSIQVIIANESRTIQITRKAAIRSIHTATKTCKSGYDPCSPSNKNSTGDGFEKHTFTYELDFAKAPFDTLTKTGEPILFISYGCCRNAFLGNLSDVMYNYAYLDLKYGHNSSPQLTADPVHYIACNQNYMYSLGVADETDNDSLSFELAEPVKDYNKPISVSYPPLTPYYPTGLKPPYYNINNDPYIGFYFDPKTGDMAFASTKCSEPATLVFEVTSWRKDSAGVYKKSAITRRDHYAKTQGVPPNNQPLIQGQTVYHVCENEDLNFTLNVTDKVYGTSDPDTLSLNFVGKIAGAKITDVSSSKPNERKVSFAWRPEESQTRSQPYRFTVEANDNFCNLNGFASRTILIYVHPKPKDTIKIADIGCNQYEVNIEQDTNFDGNVFYQWQLMDTAQNVQDISVAVFENNKTAGSPSITDTLTIRKKGKYVLVAKLTNAFGCSSYRYDTIEVANDIPGLFAKKELIVCTNDSLEIKQNLHSDTLFTSYSWNNGSTKKSYFVKYTEKQETFILQAELKNGCFYTDDIFIHRADKPKITTKTSLTICKPIIDTLRVAIQNDYSFDSTHIIWNGTKTGSSLPISTEGSYYLEAKNSCGSTFQTVKVKEIDVPQVNLAKNNAFLCNNQSVTLDAHLTNSDPTPSYLWNNKDTTPTVTVNQIGTYTLEIKNTCGMSRDTLNITYRLNSPTVDLGKDTVVCNDNPLTLRAYCDSCTYAWSNGATIDSIRKAGPSKVGVTVSNVCGSATDTINIGRQYFPVNNLPKDTFFCTGETFFLDAGNEDREVQYSWDGKGQKTRLLKIDTANKYSVYVWNACGAQSFSSNVSVKDYPVAPFGNDTTVNGDVITLDAKNPGATYMWSTGQKTPKILAVQDGTYWVEITNDCGTIRDSITVGFVGIRNVFANQLVLYPNPNQGKFTIKSTNQEVIQSVEIFDLMGREIQPLSIEFSGSGNEVFISLPAQVSLAYARIQLENGVATIPFHME